ncbi:hypothetical protein Y1Q_0011475 [Alligator mississippiensis]|uniref:Uncharacterized protein n=1 Tax=Alligator mississippiensis TaxID=8496 RepID=A0A151LZV5_ALLMI|nr:hypothetical protein Y1Q_0011475 [Alligator mississippiensis]
MDHDLNQDLKQETMTKRTPGCLLHCLDPFNFSLYLHCKSQSMFGSKLSTHIQFRIFFSAQFLYSSYATLFSLSQAQTPAAGLAAFELPWSQLVPLISSGMASFLPQLGAVSSASPESNPALG